MRHKQLFAIVLAAWATACAPRLGDGCERPTDCSINRDRTCDLAQPGGYCTIADCEPNGCGDEGLCIRFQPDEPRRSRNWCMAKCDNNGDCDRGAYRCRSAGQLNEGKALRIAESLDKNGKFCVADR